MSLCQESRRKKKPPFSIAAYTAGQLRAAENLRKKFTEICRVLRCSRKSMSLTAEVSPDAVTVKSFGCLVLRFMPRAAWITLRRKRSLL